MTGGGLARSSRVRVVAAVVAVLFVTAGAKPGGGGGGGGLAGTPTPIQIFGAWHCSDDACTWATARTVAEFDSKNHWLIDRGAPSHQPSVNLAILSFVLGFFPAGIALSLRTRSSLPAAMAIALFAAIIG